MKRKRLIFILFIALFMFMTRVNASQNPFKLDWKSEELIETFNVGAIFNSKIDYKEGYVTLYLNGNLKDITLKVTYFDKSGKIIANKNYENLAVFDATTDGEYIYALVIDNNLTMKLLRIDSNLNIIKEYQLGFSGILLINYLPVLSNIYGMSVMSIVDDKINILVKDFDILQLDLDLKNLNTVKYSEETVKKYFEKIYYLLTLSKTDNRDYLSLDKNNQYMVYSGTDYCNNIGWLNSFFSDEASTQAESACSPKNYLVLKKVNGETVWTKEFAENEIITEVKLINNYVVTIRNTENNIQENNTESNIVIYDLKGNVVQTINDNRIYSKLAKISSGFIVNNIVEDKNSCSNSSNVSPTIMINGLNNLNDIYNGEICDAQVVAEVYTIQSVPYTITSIPTEGGTVEIVESAKAGEEVKFIVTPDAGWRVYTITIKDQNGNLIKNNNNSFIMPEGNVTIEVMFGIENPNTKDIAVIAILGLAIIFGLVAIASRKKLKFLK